MTWICENFPNLIGTTHKCDSKNEQNLSTPLKYLKNYVTTIGINGNEELIKKVSSQYI